MLGPCRYLGWFWLEFICSTMHIKHLLPAGTFGDIQHNSVNEADTIPEPQFYSVNQTVTLDIIHRSCLPSIRSNAINVFSISGSINPGWQTTGPSKEVGGLWIQKSGLLCQQTSSCGLGRPCRTVILHICWFPREAWALGASIPEDRTQRGLWMGFVESKGRLGWVVPQSLKPTTDPSGSACPSTQSPGQGRGRHRGLVPNKGAVGGQCGRKDQDPDSAAHLPSPRAIAFMLWGWPDEVKGLGQTLHFPCLEPKKAYVQVDFPDSCHVGHAHLVWIKLEHLEPTEATQMWGAIVWQEDWGGVGFMGQSFLKGSDTFPVSGKTQENQICVWICEFLLLHIYLQSSRVRGKACSRLEPGPVRGPAQVWSGPKQYLKPGWKHLFEPYTFLS